MATKIPWENEEEQNYICMAKIINDIVCKELRSVFKQEWNSRYQVSFGAWDDTNASGQQLFHRERTRSRPNKNNHQTEFKHGDTNWWDCSVLFDAILYSNSIGQASLNPTIKREVNNLREIRNEITHKAKRKLTSTEFQNMTTRVKNALVPLGIPVNEIEQIKLEKNRYNYESFKILPSEPMHKVVYRSAYIHEINRGLKNLHNDNDGKLTYFYICGNPGCGKSQLARQVCEDVSNSENWETERTFVMTLDGTTLDTLFRTYKEFCYFLKCNKSAIENIASSSKPNDLKIKDFRSLISTRIRNWKKWWIIVDNVENLMEISPLLPQIKDSVWENGQIIITTQNTDCVPPDNGFTKHVSLSVGMNEQECRDLLSLLSNTDISDPSLDEVAEKLDHQPLAMAAAAAYMRQVKEPNVSPAFSWKNYLEKFDKTGNKCAEERFRRIDPTYSHSMSTAVMLAIEKCAKNDIWNHIFHLFSLISFEPMPLSLVVLYVQQQGEKLDKQDISLAIKHCSLFLLFENQGTYIRLHRVIHEGIKQFCHYGKSTESKEFSVDEPPAKRALFSSKAVIQNVVTTLRYFNGRPDRVKLIPHLKTFAKEIKCLFQENRAIYSISPEFRETDILEIYQFLAHTLYYYCELEKAKEYYEWALKIQKEQLGANHVDVATSYNNLGKVYSDKGDLEKAKEYYEWALEIQKEQLGANHVDVAKFYNNLGTVYSDKGDLEKAKEYHEWALKIQKEQLGANHVDVAKSYNNLGTVYSDKGDLEKAKEYYEWALEIQKEQLGANHVDVAMSYNNLGNVYRKTGDLEKAKEHYEWALKIQKKQLGANHVDVAKSYNNLGNVYSDKGDLEKAKEYYECALEIQKEHLGANHVDVAKSYNNLGNVYSDKGDLEKAKEYYEWALKIQKEQLGANHVDVAKSYNNLGNVYSDKGDLEKAKEYYEWALEIQKEQLGANHVDVAMCYNNLGTVYSDTGDLEKAKEYYERALEIQKEQLGANHVDVAMFYNNLGTVNSKTGDIEKAKEYYEWALKIQKEQLGANHVDVALSYYNLGTVYSKTGDLEKAKEYYERALEIQKEQLGANHVDVAMSYNNLGTVNSKTGDLEKAKEYYEWALKIQKEQLGANHVDVARSYNNLGAVYSKTGDLEKAKEYYDWALKIRKEQLGANHVDVAASYNNLGNVYRKTGDLEKAKEHYEWALKIQKQLGANHVDVAKSYNNLGNVYSDTGDLEKAKEYYEWALEIKKEQLGASHVYFVAS